MTELRFSLPYNYYEQAKRLWTAFGFTVKTEEFDTAVKISGEIREEKAGYFVDGVIYSGVNSGTQILYGRCVLLCCCTPLSSTFS